MSGRVLLLEDDADIGVVSSATLVAAGYVVDVVRTVEDALDRCASEPPDLALIDIKLGAGTSGWDFLRAIRADGLCPHMRIAVFSVHAGEADHVENARRFAVDALLAKSGDPVDLVNEVGRLLV
ncbi:MAG TPA: response regulator [Actinomycetota bacterium]|nr:response regulator [Actinomycetota bacterium]